MSEPAPLYPTSNAHRWSQRLDGLWDLQMDPDGRGERERWAAHGLPDPTPVAVPASVQEQTVDRDQWRAVATWWYQRRCFVPADGRCHQLRFGAVWHRARVFWNGELIGEHRGGHLPFAVDLPLAASGHDGLLMVAVDNRLDYHGLPHGEVITNDREEARLHIHGDVFPYTGIHRPVWLLGLPEERIESVRTHWDGAQLEVGITRREHAGRWRVRLDDGDWIEGSEDHLRFTVPEPRLWHPDDPQRYRVTIELLDTDGGPCDAYALTTGLRTISVDDDGLRVNGEAIRLRGAGYKEDGPVRGNALDEAQLVRDLQRLRWLGGNSLRTAHHPFSEELLQCCDALGILVIEELAACSIWIPDADAAGESIEINNIVHQQPTADADRIRRVAAATLADHRRQAADLVARDDHHPCIVMWSIGNEIDTRSTAAREHLGTVASDLRRLDPTRPLTLAECVGPAETTCGDLVDVISINRYYGWYLETGELERIADDWRAELARWAAHGKPLLITEFGADAVAGLHDLMANPFSEEYQWQVLERSLDVIESTPGVIGAQAWVFADFMAKATVKRVVGNKKGLFTRERQPKLAAHQLRARWRGTTVPERDTTR